MKFKKKKVVKIKLISVDFVVKVQSWIVRRQSAFGPPWQLQERGFTNSRNEGWNERKDIRHMRQPSWFRAYLSLLDDCSQLMQNTGVCILPHKLEYSSTTPCTGILHKTGFKILL